MTGDSMWLFFFFLSFCLPFLLTFLKPAWKNWSFPVGHVESDNHIYQRTYAITAGGQNIHVQNIHVHIQSYDLWALNEGLIHSFMIGAILCYCIVWECMLYIKGPRLLEGLLKAQHCAMVPHPSSWCILGTSASTHLEISRISWVTLHGILSQCPT